MKITTKQQRITPAQAKKMLEKNTENRNVNKLKVDTFARAMMAGEWMENGESVKFSESGKLLDGQHRLLAIVKANTPVQTFVVEGLADEVFATLDTGKVRNASDVLTIAGYKNTHHVSTVARMVSIYESTGLLFASLEVTNPQILEIVGRHPLICASVTYAIAHNKAFIPKSFLACLHYLFGLIDPVARDKFIEQLMTGLSESPTAATVLRDRLIDNVQSSMKLPRVDMLALSVKAFNMFRQGIIPRRLRFIGTEQFPRFE